MAEKKTFMPVKEYADMKGKSLTYIYKLIKQGKLESKKIGTYTLVRS